jgi:hypothetical protein
MSDPANWTKAYNDVKSAIESTQAELQAKPEAEDGEWLKCLKKQVAVLAGKDKNLNLVQRNEGNPGTKDRTKTLRDEVKQLLTDARKETDSEC